MSTGSRRGARGAPRTGRVHGEVQGRAKGVFDAVYVLVRAIPRGRVMTYGQISVLLGSRISPAAVGWAMHSCPEDVPWHRVVNASGGCSTERMPDIPPGMQRALLEGEGVDFRLDGTIEVERYRWAPALPGRRKAEGVKAESDTTRNEVRRRRSRRAGIPRRPAASSE